MQGLNMRPLPFSIIPTWLQVLHVLHRLGDDERVTLAAFKKHDEPAWHWAVAQRPPGKDAKGQMPHSPWLRLIGTNDARSIRLIAPLWISQPECWPITADELTQLALTNPHVRQRFQAVKSTAELLLCEHADWPWLKKALDLLHPVAIRPTDDMDDLPWSEDSKRNRLRTSVPGRPLPQVSRPTASSGDLPSAPRLEGSTRPSLRYRRPPPATGV